MSISSTDRKDGPYLCNGSTVAFDFNFKVFEESDLRVVLTDDADAETDLTLTADYTVSLNADQDTDPGGTVTTVATYASGYKITLTSEVPETQGVTITNLGGFYPEIINKSLDRLTILIQQLSEKVQRAPKVPLSSTDSIDELIERIYSAASDAADAAQAAEDALNSAAAAQAAASAIDGFEWFGSWQTATAYSKNNMVLSNGSSYICLSDHTSGAFSTDLGAGKWQVLAQQGSAGAGTGDMLAANNLSDLDDDVVARQNLGVEIGVDVQAHDPDTLKADTPDELTAGFSGAVYDAGTQSSGTFTLNEANGNLQKCVNGGAFTLAPPSNSTSIVLQVTNNGSAGAVTTSGWTKVTGSFSTTDGDDFLCYCTKLGTFSHLHIQALQ